MAKLNIGDTVLIPKGVDLTPVDVAFDNVTGTVVGFDTNGDGQPWVSVVCTFNIEANLPEADVILIREVNTLG